MFTWRLLDPRYKGLFMQSSPCFSRFAQAVLHLFYSQLVFGKVLFVARKEWYIFNLKKKKNTPFQSLETKEEGGSKQQALMRN